MQLLRCIVVAPGTASSHGYETYFFCNQICVSNAFGPLLLICYSSSSFGLVTCLGLYFGNGGRPL